MSDTVGVPVSIRTITSAPRQLSDGNGINGGPGNLLGQSPLDKVGFFGATPVVQPTGGGAGITPTADVTIYGSTQSPSAVTANTTAEESFTVTGVLATDAVFAVKPTSQAGLLVGTARVSAANTVGVTLGNDTGSSITPTASEVWALITIGAALQQTAVLTPAAVPANTVSEQFFPLPGAVPGQAILVNKPTAQAGLMIANVRIASAGQVAIQFLNLTASPITPTAGETYIFASASGFQPAPIMETITQLLTPVSVAANTAAEQTFTVPGLIAGGKVIVSKPSATPGLVVAGARVSAANTLAINYANDTSAAIIPPPETYLIASFSTQAGNTASTSTVLPASKGNTSGVLVQLGLAAGT